MATQPDATDFHVRGVEILFRAPLAELNGEATNSISVCMFVRSREGNFCGHWQKFEINKLGSLIEC